MAQVRDNKSKTQYAYISHKEQQQQMTPSLNGVSGSNVNEIAKSLPEGLVSFDDEVCSLCHGSRAVAVDWLASIFSVI